MASSLWRSSVTRPSARSRAIGTGGSVRDARATVTSSGSWLTIAARVSWAPALRNRSTSSSTSTTRPSAASAFAASTLAATARNRRLAWS